MSYHFLRTEKKYLHADIWLYCFSKEISGFAALKRTIREVENGLVDKSGNKSQIRVHKKKKDAMVSPKATKWLDSISQWEIEIGLVELTFYVNFDR